MARDPLSYAPVVLGDFKTPQVAQGIMQQRIAMEQDKKAKDAEKMQLLQNLSDVEAYGWERDQGMIDDAQKKHEEMVADIMYNSSGIPTGTDLRRIERSRAAIENMAKVSVADKKAFQQSLRDIANKHKQLDVNAALEGLYKHYGQPVTTRGVFDINPYFKPEEAPDIYKPFAQFKLGVDTSTKRFPSKADPNVSIRTVTPSVKRVEYMNSIKNAVASGGDYLKAYQYALNSGQVKDLDGFARLQLATQEGGLNLRSEYSEFESKKSDDGGFVYDNNIVLADRAKTTTGEEIVRSGPGYYTEGMKSFKANYNGEVFDFEPRAIVNVNGEDIVEGYRRVPSQKMKLTKKEYQTRVNSGEIDPNDMSWSFSEDPVTGNEIYTKTIPAKDIPVEIPLIEIADEFNAHAKSSVIVDKKIDFGNTKQTKSKQPSWTVSQK